MDRERRTGRNIKKGKKRKSAKYKRVRAFLFLVMTAVLVCMLFTGRTAAELKGEMYRGIASLYIQSRYFP